MKRVGSPCKKRAAACFTDAVGAVYCGGTLVSYPSDSGNLSYTVAPNTRIIGDGAFSENRSLQEVVLPDGVVMIRAYAFEGCSSLTNVDLPETLLIIDDRAFALCHALNGISLPPSLYGIGRQAFEDNWSLTEITLPASLRYVGDEAFARAMLKEVLIYTL